MKVLVADKFEESGLNGLKALGCEVVYEPALAGDALAEAIRSHGPSILVVRSTKVGRPAIESGSLGVIIRAGAGVNTIDVEAASERGIFVANCPGKNAIAVAELAFGLILALDRHIAACDREFREGHWNKKAYSKARGLAGRTLGLVGMGSISQEMIPRARAFGMTVIAHSRWMTPEVAAALGIGRAETLEDLAAQADIVSLHVSLRPETRGMIGEAFLSRMKPGAMLVNTSRAEVVDEPALIAAVSAGRIKAGLDVFANEPTESECAIASPLAGLPGVVVTHHIGASTDQAQEAVASETVRIVKDYILTGVVPNVVNVAKAGAHATHLLVVRHVDKVGVLADIFAILKEAGISVQEMENVVLGAAKAAIAQISLDKEAPAEVLGAIKAHPAVFDGVQMPISAALNPA